MSARDAVLARPEIFAIVTSIIVGFLARWSILKVDYRQYPTYPNAYLIHLTTGFLAAAAGAIAIPALLSKNFTAITFLTVAIQQFRDVRKSEREALQDLEHSEYSPRGKAYIDGIAKTFEGRNYLTLITSLVTSIVFATKFTNNLWLRALVAAATGALAFLLLRSFTKGMTLSDVADVRQGQLQFQGANLYVDDVYVMNVGLSKVQQKILKEGIGILLVPKGENESLIVGNSGQRQAVEHEVSRLMGLERYIGIRRNFKDGRVALAFVPVRNDPQSTIQVVSRVPVLETVKKIVKE